MSSSYNINDIVNTPKRKHCDGWARYTVMILIIIDTYGCTTLRARLGGDQRLGAVYYGPAAAVPAKFPRAFSTAQYTYKFAYHTWRTVNEYQPIRRVDLRQSRDQDFFF